MLPAESLMLFPAVLVHVVSAIPVKVKFHEDTVKGVTTAQISLFKHCVKTVTHRKLCLYVSVHSK